MQMYDIRKDMDIWHLDVRPIALPSNKPFKEIPVINNIEAKYFINIPIKEEICPTMTDICKTITKPYSRSNATIVQYASVNYSSDMRQE